ncbi:hypothetical protein [Frigoribacterium sp. Leaf254]|uniref:hypothetical protein n=1 Tax=Frigoribacterium sp. Leaf254 TaxID=1736308 RepID=UPI0012F82490|nr:hypothetical protein [Frigoribacterium sp. Leaf254]
MKVAVPTTPGVRPRLVRASTKDASTATWVSTPLLRSAIDAAGVDAALGSAEDELEDDVSEDEPESIEQAASEKTRAPEATRPSVVLVMFLRVKAFMMKLCWSRWGCTGFATVAEKDWNASTSLPRRDLDRLVLPHPARNSSVSSAIRVDCVWCR